MKYKLTIAIVTLILVLGLAIGESIFIKHTFSRFNEKLEYLMQQEEYVYEDVKEVGEWWEKRSQWLEISVSVVQLNEITVTYGELVGAVENQDYDSASALLNRIYQYSIHICDMYMLKIENVL